MTPRRLSKDALFLETKRRALVASGGRGRSLTGTEFQTGEAKELRVLTMWTYLPPLPCPLKSGWDGKLFNFFYYNKINERRGSGAAKVTSSDLPDSGMKELRPSEERPARVHSPGRTSEADCEMWQHGDAGGHRAAGLWPTDHGRR